MGRAASTGVGGTVGGSTFIGAGVGTGGSSGSAGNWTGSAALFPGGVTGVSIFRGTGIGAGNSTTGNAGSSTFAGTCGVGGKLGGNAGKSSTGADFTTTVGGAGAS